MKAATTPVPVVSTPARTAFERLAALNVNDRIEKKNGLNYLSWAWAWDQLLRQDATASYVYAEPKVFGDNTLMVFCTVTAFGLSRTAHLPVMDHRNKAVSSPDAFAVNTAMQRALVKAIALHGLGLYIYAGEDLPLAETPEPEPAFDYAGWLTTEVRPRAEQGQATLLAYLKTAPAAGRDALRADRTTWAAVLKVAKAADFAHPLGRFPDAAPALSNVTGGAV